jgi:hypothetical protein
VDCDVAWCGTMIGVRESHVLYRLSGTTYRTGTHTRMDTMNITKRGNRTINQQTVLKLDTQNRPLCACSWLPPPDSHRPKELKSDPSHIQTKFSCLTLPLSLSEELIKPHHRPKCRACASLIGGPVRLLPGRRIRVSHGYALDTQANQTRRVALGMALSMALTLASSGASVRRIPCG